MDYIINNTPPHRMPKLVSRSHHFWYVTLLCDAFFITLAAILANFFPYYSKGQTFGVPIYYLKGISQELPFNEVSRILNPSIAVFLFGGLFFAFPFSIVLNRISMVATSGPKQVFIPVSRLARYGKALIGWRGALVLLGIIIIYVGLGLLRPVYYRISILGRVAGLSVSQDRSVRMWTVFYLFNHPRSATADALAVTANQGNDSEVKLMAALDLGKLKDPRALIPLIGVIENHDWAACRAVKLLTEIDRPALAEQLHKALEIGQTGRQRQIAADLIIYTAGKDFRNRFIKVINMELDDDIPSAFILNLPSAPGSGWHALKDEIQLRKIAKDISRYYAENKDDIYWLSNRLGRFIKP
ncbi:MAG: HEAT repeat domain-containing protein [Planctomycetota bacterium]|jgi:hypothetical protein